MGNSSLCTCKYQDVASESNIFKPENFNENNFSKQKILAELQITEKNIWGNNVKTSQFTESKDYKTSPIDFQLDLATKKKTKTERLEEIKLSTSARKITQLFRLFRELKANGHFQKQNVADEQPASNQPIDINLKKLQDMNSHFKFIGTIINNLKEGLGFQIWGEDAKYVGNFQSNTANGYGIFKHSDGDNYSGEFINDRSDGFGVYNHSNGGIYVGTWMNDLQEGLGTEVWRDGSMYEGEYMKGKKHGIGVYKWPDGCRYEGEWRENTLHGYGIYYYNDSRTYSGQWKSNAMDGFGEFEWNDGKRYIGYHSNDKREGFGIYYWQSPNRAYIGFWKNGKQEGVGKYMTPYKVKYGLWDKGEKVQWYPGEKEALLSLQGREQSQYLHLFKYDLNSINLFLTQSKQEKFGDV